MNPYLVFVLVVLIGFTLWDALVNWLNVRAIQKEIPQEFAGVYDADKYQKSQEYLRESTRFDLVSDLIRTSGSVVFILVGGFAWVNTVAEQAATGLIPRGLIFVGILTLISTIVSLPFSWYGTFVLEEKYGFNKTSKKTFFVDIVKNLMLSIVIGAPVLALILWFFASAGGNAWWISWIVVFLISLVLMYVAPVWILPIFNKFTPLEDGDLKERIEAYSNKQGFEVSGRFSIDGSKRSTLANAYFTGFGKTRRIALFDTLINNHKTNELVAILAHEVGHAKLKHIHKMVAVFFFTTGLMFFLLSIFIGEARMYAAFGIESDPLPIYAGLFFFGFLFSPISSVLSIFQNMLSRKHEFEADAYAVETTGSTNDLIDGLKKLSVDNLSNLTPHPLLVFLEYSHPPVLTRIEAMRGINLPKND